MGTLAPERVRARRAKLWRLESHPATSQVEREHARRTRESLESEYPWLQNEPLSGSSGIVDDVQTASSDWEWIIRQGKIDPQMVRSYLEGMGERLLSGFVQSLLNEISDLGPQESSRTIDLDPRYGHKFVEKPSDNPGMYFQLFLSKEDLHLLEKGGLTEEDKQNVLMALAEDMREKLRDLLNKSIWKEK